MIDCSISVAAMAKSVGEGCCREYVRLERRLLRVLGAASVLRVLRVLLVLGVLEVLPIVQDWMNCNELK